MYIGHLESIHSLLSSPFSCVKHHLMNPLACCFAGIDHLQGERCSMALTGHRGAGMLILAVAGLLIQITESVIPFVLHRIRSGRMRGRG